MPPTPLPPIPSHLVERGVALRPQQDADGDFVREVFIASRWDEVLAASWPEVLGRAFLADQFRLQDLHYHKHYQGAAWGIVEVAGQPAGRLTLLLGEEELRIVDIALLPAYRNLGLGRGLIEAVQDQARELGLAKVSLHVEQHNRAQRLYRRLGFRRIGVGGTHALMEWTVIVPSAPTPPGRRRRDRPRTGG